MGSPREQRLGRSESMEGVNQWLSVMGFGQEPGGKELPPGSEAKRLPR